MEEPRKDQHTPETQKELADKPQTQVFEKQKAIVIIIFHFVGTIMLLGIGLGAIEFAPLESTYDPGVNAFMRIAFIIIGMVLFVKGLKAIKKFNGVEEED